MNNLEFEQLSSDLRNLASNIPLHWGAVQNNRMDDKLDMFSIKTYQELESAISHMNDKSKNYWRRRWYIWQCSQCDEFLFYINDGVLKNPNPYDKSYDVMFKNGLAFDVKGTVIPSAMRDRAEELILNPADMIKFYYDKQSTGRRYDIQNRLFLVHHSFVSNDREFYLRCAWKSKTESYRTFSENISSINFIDIYNVKAGAIFILERIKGIVETKIYGL